MTVMLRPPADPSSAAVVAAMAPAANSSESPGRNGVITRPVSQNSTTNKIA